MFKDREKTQRIGAKEEGSLRWKTLEIEDKANVKQVLAAFEKNMEKSVTHWQYIDQYLSDFRQQQIPRQPSDQYQRSPSKAKTIKASEEKPSRLTRPRSAHTDYES